MIKKTPLDALALLTRDHWKLKRLFDEIEDSAAPALGGLAAEALATLKAHAALEEELLDPALAKAGVTFDHPATTHGGEKPLIAELEAMDPSDPAYKGKLLALAEGALEHIRVEEEEVFPAARKARVNLPSLGRIMAERRDELLPGG